jgi:tetratricopeptide (TPR) repeat protein
MKSFVSFCGAFFALLFVFTPLARCAAQTEARAQDVSELISAQKLAASGQYPEAIGAYRTFLLAHPEDETASVELSECYRRVRNVEEAFNILHLTRRQHPKSIRVLKAIGSLEIEAQSYDAAVEALRSALALAPGDLEARNFLGSAYLGKNDSTAALAEFNHVLMRDPQNQLAHYFRAQIYSDTGGNKEALADAEAVVAARPNYVPGRVLFAKLLIREKQCARAVETLSEAHEARQLDAQPLFILANAYDCAGQPEQAKSVREEFATASQNEHQRAEGEIQSKHLVEQANQMAIQSKLPEALGLLQQALDKNPENAFAFSQKAKILFSTGDTEGARGAIQRALSLQPFQPDFLYVDGVIAAGEKKLEEAIAAFTRVTEINPNEADAFFEIGKIRTEQGDRRGALAAFRKAAALDPNDPDYQRAVADASAAPR